jgi:hypothetical protein
MMWMSYSTANPNDGLLPTNFGWISTDGVLQPVWFEGPALPENLFQESVQPHAVQDSHLEVPTGHAVLQPVCSTERALPVDVLQDSFQTDVNYHLQDDDDDAEVCEEETDDDAWSEDSDTDDN